MKALPFPLYHGTSSLFDKSIKEFGLGGFDPIKKWNIIELLKILEKLADNTISHIEEWTYGLKYPVSLITGQRITNAGNNYQHGDTYLTPTLRTAMCYSQNKFGSEAISEVFKVVRLLRIHKIQFESEIPNKLSHIFEIEKIDCSPLIYEIKNLPIEYLSMGECGEDLILQIDQVIQAKLKYGETHYEDFVDQTNFRAAKSIPWGIVNYWDE